MVKVEWYVEIMFQVFGIQRVALIKDFLSCSLLHVAASLDNLEVATWLVENGANINHDLK